MIDGKLSRTEILALIAKAKETGEITPVYNIIADGSDAKRWFFLHRWIDKWSKLNSQWLYYSEFKDRKSGKEHERNVELDRANVFTNYWHAYAFYAQKAGRTPTNNDRSS